MKSDGESDGAVGAAGTGASTASSGAGAGGGSASGTGSGGNGSGGGNGGDGPLPCAEYVVTDLPTPVDRLAITPDKSTLVWTSDPEKGPVGDKSIMSIVINGGKPSTLVPANLLKEVRQLAVNTSRVFWLTGQEMDATMGPAWHGSSAPLSMPGGIATFTEEIKPTQALAVTDGPIYWTVPEEGRIAYQSSMGIASPLLIASAAQLEGADTLLVTGGHVYWRRKSTPGGLYEAIMYVSDVPPMAPDPGIPVELVKTSFASDFSIQGDFVFWTAGDPKNGSINRGTISLGQVTKSVVLQDGIPFPTHFSIGPVNIYWAEGNSNDCSQVVKRLDAGSGNATIKPMSRGDRCVSNFVEDNLYVYWGSGKMICRAPL